jgi:hypothetical protein
MTFFGRKRCPLCGAALWAPNEAIGSRMCPRCGAELWVLLGSDGPLFFVRQPDQTKYSFLASLLGLSEDQVVEMLRRADSLDLVEIVMDIEDRLKGHPQSRT